MSKLFTTLFAFLLLCQGSFAQSIFDQVNDPYFGETCTSILVGKKASTDGSVITSHTCDGKYRTWMTVEKGQKFKNDTITSIYKGLLKTESKWDLHNVTKVEEISQEKETFTFFNTTYPFLNKNEIKKSILKIKSKFSLFMLLIINAYYSLL